MSAKKHERLAGYWILAAPPGPKKSRMVHELVRKLTAAGVGIFQIANDMPEVFGLSDRLSVMKGGKAVGTFRTAGVTESEVLAMIIADKKVSRVPEMHRLAPYFATTV